MPPWMSFTVQETDGIIKFFIHLDWKSHKLCCVFKIPLIMQKSIGRKTYLDYP